MNLGALGPLATKRNMAIAGVGGFGLVVVIGRRRAKKSAASGPAAAQGYADTAADSSYVYTGYDQLEQQIQALQAQPGAANPNPVPAPTSAPGDGQRPPLAPVPPPPSHPSPPARVPAPTATYYTVQRNDTLSKIAKRKTGNANNWRKIYANNRRVIGSNPDRIRPGERLRIS